MIGRLFWLFVGSIVYTYAGYPLVLALLAQGRRRVPPAASTVPPPSVTLLIAAYNEEAVIAEKLDNSLALAYPPDRLQILVAADGSADGTVAIVRAYAERGAELSYRAPRSGKMAAINWAMPHARGDIIVLSDANNLYDHDTLRELAAPFADPTVGAVTGSKAISRGDGALSDSEGLYWRYESFIKERETWLGCCTAVAGEVLAIRRELFESPPDQVINDDFYIAMRLIRRGHRVVYVPTARSSERVSVSAQDEIARRARIAAGRYQALALAAHLLPWRRPILIWQVVSHKFLRLFVPLAMIGALLTNLAAVARPARTTDRLLLDLAPPAGGVVLGLQTAFYGAAWIGGRVHSEGTMGRLLYLPTFLVNSNVAVVIGLYRFVTRRQTTLWERVQRRPSIS